MNKQTKISISMRTPIIHIFETPSLKNSFYIRFIKTYFRDRDHRFYYANKLFIKKKNFKDSNIIILHGFPGKLQFLLFWFFNKRYLNWVIWSISGPDLEPLKNKYLEKLKTYLVRRIYGILSDIKSDLKLVEAQYNRAFCYYRALTPPYLDADHYKNYFYNFKHKAPVILIGFSSGPECQHHSLLKSLETPVKMASEAVRIKTFLLEHPNNYAMSVTSYGRNLYGPQFIPVFKTKNPEQAEVFSTSTILIDNSKQPHNIETILSFLLMGKKVYLRSNTRLYKYLSDELGCKIYQTEDILEGEVEMKNILEMYSKHRHQNKKKIEQLLKTTNLTSQWGNVFNL